MHEKVSVCWTCQCLFKLRMFDNSDIEAKGIVEIIIRLSISQVKGQEDEDKQRESSRSWEMSIDLSVPLIHRLTRVDRLCYSWMWNKASARERERASDDDICYHLHMFHLLTARRRGNEKQIYKQTCIDSQKRFRWSIQRWFVIAFKEMVRGSAFHIWLERGKIQTSRLFFDGLEKQRLLCSISTLRCRKRRRQWAQGYADTRICMM